MKEEIEKNSPAYLPRLLGLESPPDVLYVKGDARALAGAPLVAVTGARRATPYGVAVAEATGRELAEAGAVVVSGGAMGCDVAALRAAQAVGGRTVVVTGTGADVVYPASSRDAFDRATCVISAEPWGTPPKRWAFPKRNRLMAALADTLVVTEAGLRSGTYQTADEARRLGRRVLAVPGSIYAPESCGTNVLIAEGATPVLSVGDVVRIAAGVGHEDRGPRPAGSSLVAALVASPLRAPELASALGTSVAEVMRELATREASGDVVRLPDGRWAPSRLALARAVA